MSTTSIGRKGRELTLDEKRSIISHTESGLKSEKVAESLHLNSSTIRRFLKQFCERGSMENKHRSGRPRCMTVCNQTTLSKMVKRDRKKTLTNITGNFNRSVPKPFQVEVFSKNYIVKNIRGGPQQRNWGCRNLTGKKKLQYCREKLTWKVKQHWKHGLFNHKITIVIHV